MAKPIDLRSDTVTRPDPGMRQAMAEAVVGEDFHREDPTVNLLEEQVAKMLGKEAALFVPTGSLGNLVALKLHTQPGEEVILEEQSHIYDAEMASMSAVCGLLARPVHGDEVGMFSWEDVKREIRPRVYSRPQTRLICLENTHNYRGGTIINQEQAVDLYTRAHDVGLKVHLDGARLWNASVASGRSLAELVACCDSVMVDFAKALGAPAGAVLAVPSESIERARSARKLFGGAVHQPGVMAAGCLYGLEHVLPRLEEDHRNAKRLARALADLPGVSVDAERVVTNIVLVTLGPEFDVPGVCKTLREKGVLVNPLEDGRLRFVTHYDVSQADIDLAIEAISETLRAAGKLTRA